MATKKTARGIYADSESNADMRYLSGLFVPDPFWVLDIGGRRIGVFNQLEINRARNESSLDEVLSLEACREAILKNSERAGPAEIAHHLCRQFGITTLEVPFHFPHGLALALKALGTKVVPLQGAFVPERLRKQKQECEQIRLGNRASAQGIARAKAMLKESEIRGNYLYHEGKRLTSEKVREAIDIACLRVGARAAHTIVAGGDQACDPHCSGSGPLHPHELIIVDVFPRLQESGYFGDMTRTFLKGRASDEQVRLVEAVRKAQQASLEAIAAKYSASKVHEAAKGCFEALGYKTGLRKGVPCGFFHSTGHGLGLEIHEAPRLGPNGPKKLAKGTVVTVEPGLYYPGLGGCRIEDVVVITKEGYEMLSKSPYTWLVR